MTPMEQVEYQYWTGTQWLPKYIYIGPVMKTGWHIFNVVMCLVFLPWVLVYLIMYLSAYNDADRKTRWALEQIEDYYARLNKDREDLLKRAGLVE